nr:ROK family protein [Actinomycetota bacterium]
MNHVLGIDIGGTGIKAAPVDVTTGRLLAERAKVATPRPATPAAVEAVLRQLISDFAWSGPLGITFPGVVIDGTIRTAANLHPDWIGVSVADLLNDVTAGKQVAVIND